jgi:hypothetical protein
VTSGGPSVEVRLDGDAVQVTGEGLDTARHALFFRSVLGGAPNAKGWECPTRGRPGADLVIEIAQRLERLGYSVTASGAADRALTTEIERVRSFGRATTAAIGFLGLSGAEPVSPIAEDDVMETLREMGWNFDERDPLPHQRHGILHALNAVNAANFSVPGAGKTATALAVAASHLAQGTIDLVVVVGPLSSFAPWERECARAAPGIVNPRRVRAGSRRARAEIYRRARPRELLLLSFATAASDQSELEALCRRANAMLVVDESHRVKRFRGGIWAPALMEIARFARVKLILSGTPMPQSGLDLYSQLNILWPGGELTGSRATYAARAESDFDAVIRRVEPFFVRTPKSQLDLPEARFYRHPVELAPLQLQIYDLIFTRLRAEIPDAARWSDRIDALRRARPIRLIQAASNPDLLNEADGFFEIPPLRSPSGTLMERLHRYREFGELPAKFQFALDFLRGLQGEGRKCVVWTSFIRNIDQLSRLVREQLGASVFSVDGRVPAAENAAHGAEEIDETREWRIDRFLAEKGFAVLIANPAACAESISLHCGCHTALYIDRTHDCARWLQSIDRIHRLGLAPDDRVEIHVAQAVTDGAPTIDAVVDNRLLAKENNMRQLLESAELRAAGLAGQDTLTAAEGSEEDLGAILKYLLGEE